MSLIINATLAKTGPRSETTKSSQNPGFKFDATAYRLQIKSVSAKYCRDEIVHYLGGGLRRFVNANPNVRLSAFGKNLKFSTNAKSIEDSVKAIMGPWYKSISPMASPYLIRTVIGHYRNNQTAAYLDVLQAIRTANEKGIPPIDDIRLAWNLDYEYGIMGAMGLVSLSRLARPAVNSKRPSPNPNNYVEVFPAAQFLKAMQ